MKQFISHETIRADAYKLAHKMFFEDHFVPDIIYTALRGGAVLSNCISEYFKLVLPKDHKPILYAGVVAHSYSDFSIGVAGNVKIDGWTYSPDWLRPGDKILLVDDLWDSGQTLIALEKALLAKGIERKNLKVCVHDYKVRNDLNTNCGAAYVPDYYKNLIKVNSKEENPWIHYESHELVGLTENERSKLYTDFSGDNPTIIDSELKKVLDDAFNKGEN